MVEQPILMSIVKEISIQRLVNVMSNVLQLQVMHSGVADPK